MALDMGDDALLAAWQRGDRDAGTQLFRQHFPAIRRFFRNKVSPDDVEDLVQRTFAGLVECMPRFRGDASFRVLLFSIAHRQFYKFLRDKARELTRMTGDGRVSSIQALGLSPSNVVAEAENHCLLQQALQQVQVPYQVVLELHYWEDLTPTEIAKILEIPAVTVRTRLHRARAALDKVLARRFAGSRFTSTDSLTTAMQSLGARL